MISKPRSFFEIGLSILRNAGLLEEESKSPSEPPTGEHLRKITKLKAKLNETYACLSRHKARRETYKKEAKWCRSLQKAYPKDHALYILYGKRWSAMMSRTKIGKRIIARLEHQLNRLQKEYHREVFLYERSQLGNSC